MKTVGEILKSAREANQLTLADVSKKTKITTVYLTAIEANDFKSLPAATFTKGFLKNYATVLNLNPENILAIFRRDYDQDERGHIIPRGLTEPVKAPFNFITPSHITLVFSVLIGLILVIYFARQIIIFTKAPVLTLTAPLDNAQVVSPVKIVGKTHPEATVTVNNEPVLITEDGSFNKDLELSPGDHTLVLVAKSRSGNSRTLQRTVLVLVDKTDQSP